MIDKKTCLQWVAPFPRQSGESGLSISALVHGSLLLTVDMTSASGPAAVTSLS